MLIQFNADKHLTIHEDFNNKLSAHIKEKLSRFSEHITRIEVHLSDDNGSKQGPDDKKCLLEARVEGRPPVVVSATGNNYEIAVDAAIVKIRSSLDTIFDKLKNF